VRQFPFVRTVVSTQQLGQAEIEHLHGPVGAYDDVSRFQIAMNDAAGVRGRQGIGDGNRNPQHLAQAHAVSRYARIETLAAYVRHDNEVTASEASIS